MVVESISDGIVYFHILAEQLLAKKSTALSSAKQHITRRKTGLKLGNAVS